MDERESTRAEIDDSRERMKDIAEQLIRRAQPDYLKQRAKEAAVEKSMVLKDRVIGSPIALGIIGGLATAGIAKMFLNRKARSNSARYAGRIEGEAERFGEKVKTQVTEKVAAVKEQAGHFKDQAMHQVDNVRDRLPSADDVKNTARQITVRGRDYAAREPLVTALGALAIGAAFGFLLPLTAPERRLLAPARERVGEKLESFSSELTEKVEARVDALQEPPAPPPSPPPAQHG